METVICLGTPNPTPEAVQGEEQPQAIETVADVLQPASHSLLQKAGVVRRRRRPRRSPLRARQQGDSDGLCGFYAVINGLRLAFKPHGGLSLEEERVIWRSIVRYADRNWRFASLFLGGTGDIILDVPK